jgi:hypothetical protein
MLEMLRDLIAHKGHADALANRFWLLTVVSHTMKSDAGGTPPCRRN